MRASHPPAVLRPSSAAVRAAGLGLKTDDVKTALAQGKAIIYAFVSINLITGLFAFIMVQLPFGKTPRAPTTVRARQPWACAECAEMTTDPPELAVGLAVFCAMPTTLSSGAVLVDQVRSQHSRHPCLMGRGLCRSF